MTENDFFELSLAKKDVKIGWKYLSAYFSSFWDYGRVFIDNTFYAIKEAPLSESITSERFELWGSCFFKMFQIDCPFQNFNTKLDQIFNFLQNYLWTGSSNISLLLREY